MLSQQVSGTGAGAEGPSDSSGSGLICTTGFVDLGPFVLGLAVPILTCFMCVEHKNLLDLSLL